MTSTLRITVDQPPRSVLPLEKYQIRINQDNLEISDLTGSPDLETYDVIVANPAITLVELRAVSGANQDRVAEWAPIDGYEVIAGSLGFSNAALTFRIVDVVEPPVDPEDPPPPPLPDAEILSTTWISSSAAPGGTGTQASPLQVHPDRMPLIGERWKFKGGEEHTFDFNCTAAGTVTNPIVFDFNLANDWGSGPAVVTHETAIETTWTSSTVNGATVWTTQQADLYSPLYVFQGTRERFITAQYPLSLDADGMPVTPLRANGNFRGGNFWAIPLAAKTNTTIDVNANPTAKAWLDAAHAVEPLETRTDAIVWSTNNLRSTRKIISYIAGVITHEWHSRINKSTHYFAIANHPSALRCPGQMIYRDNNDITVRMSDGQNPNLVSMSYPGDCRWGLRMGNSHQYLWGGLWKRMRPTGNAKGTNAGAAIASVFVLPDNASGRTGARIIGPTIEECYGYASSSVAHATVRINTWSDFVVRDLTMTLCTGYGIAAFDTTNGWILGCNITKTSTTAITARRMFQCGFIGNFIGEVASVHGNCISVYEGNEDCLFLFNNMRNENQTATAPIFVGHGFHKCAIAFNIAVHRGTADSAVVLSQWTPNTTYPRHLDGDGPFNIWANNIAWSNLGVAMNPRDGGNPGAIIINNFADTLKWVREPVAALDWVNLYGDGTMTTYDAATAEQKTAYRAACGHAVAASGFGNNHIGNNNNTGSNMPTSTAQSYGQVFLQSSRATYFAGETEYNFIPVDPRADNGIAWTFDTNLASDFVPVPISHVTPYKRNGTLPFDWRDINWGGLNP